MTYSNPDVDLLASVLRVPVRNPQEIDDNTVPEEPKSPNLLFTYDDPDRSAFFLPISILLFLHIVFLLHVYLYAPNPDNLFIK